MILGFGSRQRRGPERRAPEGVAAGRDWTQHPRPAPWDAAPAGASATASTVGVGVIGYGYWGPNLVRNFAEAPGARMAAVSDLQAARLSQVRARYPAVKTTIDHRDLLADPSIDAVAIATPVSTHFELAMEALRAGKHVLVEKPLAPTSEQASRLIDEAARRHHLDPGPRPQALEEAGPVDLVVVDHDHREPAGRLVLHGSECGDGARSPKSPAGMPRRPCRPGARRRPPTTKILRVTAAARSGCRIVVKSDTLRGLFCADRRSPWSSDGRVRGGRCPPW